MLTTDSFSQEIRERTREEHRNAEESEFVTALMNGELSVVYYGGFARQLQAIYAELDSAAAKHRDDPRFGEFFDPELDRTDAFAADLVALNAADLPLTEATRQYVRRLREVSDVPLLVLAHHYTRYLGDLSGGRMIAARLSQHYGLTTDHGLAFYDFSHLGAGPAYKTRYRAMLDQLLLSAADRAAFITESRRAFRLNAAVFGSLELQPS